ncbi:hypothetical protein C8R45DRAFT_934047 [Mycena sanguinolenta]|nr:hypothetical protein C8R45DRAFT_934047 [Mycena sanguinolenta]
MRSDRLASAGRALVKDTAPSALTMRRGKGEVDIWLALRACFGLLGIWKLILPTVCLTRYGFRTVRVSGDLGEEDGACVREEVSQLCSPARVDVEVQKCEKVLMVLMAKAATTGKRAEYGSRTGKTKRGCTVPQHDIELLEDVALVDQDVDLACFPKTVARVDLHASQSNWTGIAMQCFERRNQAQDINFQRKLSVLRKVVFDIAVWTESLHQNTILVTHRMRDSGGLFPNFEVMGKPRIRILIGQAVAGSIDCCISEPVAGQRSDP